MIYPPRINQEFDISPFADGLRDVIPDKITKILTEMDEVQERYDMWKTAVKNCKLKGELNEYGVYFWLALAELEYSEYFIYQKWLIYWMNLYEKIPEIVMPIREKYKDFIDKKMEIERARRTPIENFYDGQLRDNGTRLLGKCPFHEERTPSFFIFTNNNTFHCFGCQENGDVIDFIRKTRKLDFFQAMEVLL